MRASRLLAASAAITVSLGMGTGMAVAAPLADPTATTVPTSPAGPTGPTTAGATAPAPSGSTTPAPGPTGTASAPTSAPAPSGPATGPTGGAATTPAVATGQPCHQDGRVPLNASWTGLQNVRLVKGGPAAESTLTIRNTSGRALPDFSAYLVLNSSRSLTWEDDLTMEIKPPGGAWSPMPLGERRPTNLGKPRPYQLAKDEVLTFALRLTASGSRAGGDVSLVWLSTANLSAAEAGPGNCTIYTADAHAEFTVLDTTAPGPTPSTSADFVFPAPSATRPAASSASPGIALSPVSASTSTSSSSTSASTASRTVPPSPAPPSTGNLAQAGGQGDGLAHTGSGSTTAMAVGGSAALTAGLGTLLVAHLRRRRASS
ncbi:hypothetical protein [Kitasatospora sp. NPDC050543]|uniref:hypothetical protein n=1 Tax=Kitasatospora sp. NPDC050543 TaxID=3364054 RepID=UPI00378FCFE8